MAYFNIDTKLAIINKLRSLFEDNKLLILKWDGYSQTIFFKSNGSYLSMKYSQAEDLLFRKEKEYFDKGII